MIRYRKQTRFVLKSITIFRKQVKTGIFDPQIYQGKTGFQSVEYFTYVTFGFLLLVYN